MITEPIKWAIPSEGINEIFSSDVHIWMADLSLVSKLKNSLYKTLSADELRHAEQFKYEHHRNDYIIARGILRTLISRYLAIEANQIEFSYNQYGKPSINLSEDSFYFNLSHSSGIVLYIFSKDFEVGIDIEQIHPVENIMEIAKQFFSKQEYNKLLTISADKQLESFFKCWTRKESFIKAIGNGLSYPLEQFDVSIDICDPAKFEKISGSCALAKEWSLYSVQPHQNYESAFCFKGKCDSVKFWQFTI